jgi:VanZ family protein
MTERPEAPPRAPAPGKRGPRPSLLWYVTPAAVYLPYIFFEGTKNDPETPLGVSDKTAHFVAFGLMVPLFTRALRYFWPATPRWRLILAAAGLASLAGALLELWQSFLPFRTAEFLDWAADTVGAAAAAVLVAIGWRLFREMRDRARAPSASRSGA